MKNKIAVIGGGTGQAAIVCMKALQEVFPESDIQQAENIQINDRHHDFRNPYVEELQYVVVKREIYTPIEVNRRSPRNFKAIGNSRVKPQQVIRRPRYQKCH